MKNRDFFWEIHEVHFLNAEIEINIQKFQRMFQNNAKISCEIIQSQTKHNKTWDFISKKLIKGFLLNTILIIKSLISEVKINIFFILFSDLLTTFVDFWTKSRVFIENVRFKFTSKFPFQSQNHPICLYFRDPLDIIIYIYLIIQYFVKKNFFKRPYVLYLGNMEGIYQNIV